MSWPKRHLHRCGVFWQMNNALSMCKRVNNDAYWGAFQQIANPQMANSGIAVFKANARVTAPLGVTYWTPHEISEFAIIEEKLRDLYQNRYIAYREMVKEEYKNKHN